MRVFVTVFYCNLWKKSRKILSHTTHILTHKYFEMGRWGALLLILQCTVNFPHENEWVRGKEKESAFVLRTLNESSRAQRVEFYFLLQSFWGIFYNLAFSHLFGVGFFGTNSAFFYLALFLKGSIPAEGRKYKISLFILLLHSEQQQPQSKKKGQKAPFFSLNSHNQWHRLCFFIFLFSFHGAGLCVVFVRVY